MKIIVIILLSALSLTSCKKDGRSESPVDYWTTKLEKKQTEIQTLLNSVSCSNMEEFNLEKREDWSVNYYLVHPSVEVQFNQLVSELEELRREWLQAVGESGMVFDAPPLNPPLRRSCIDNKATLVYAQDLLWDEVNEELPKFYEDIKGFYNEVACVDESDWLLQKVAVNCCYEMIPVHKTLRREEFHEKVAIYEQMMLHRDRLQPRICHGYCPPVNEERIICVDGRPTVI